MNENLEQLLANLRRDLQNAMYYDVDTRLAAISNFEKTIQAIRQLVSGQKPQSATTVGPHPRPPIRPTKLGRPSVTEVL